jgi:uncharacterized protein DUF6882
MARSIEELAITTAIFDRQFQLGQAAWQLSQGSAVITFTSPTGMIASAPAQIVGTYDTDDGTWLWAWDNPTILPKLAKHAKLTRQYGKRQRISDLTTPKLTIAKKRCWEFAALTCKLGGFQCAYRGPAGRTIVFITFGEVELGKFAWKGKRTTAR